MTKPRLPDRRRGEKFARLDPTEHGGTCAVLEPRNPNEDPDPPARREMERGRFRRRPIAAWPDVIQ